jgi:hypothetical protein
LALHIKRPLVHMVWVVDKPENDAMANGTVKWYNAQKGSLDLLTKTAGAVASVAHARRAAGRSRPVPEAV